jgi:hypothetical protein
MENVAEEGGWGCGHHTGIFAKEILASTHKHTTKGTGFKNSSSPVY